MMMALFVVTRLQQKKCYIDAISNKVFKLQNLMVYNELLQVRKMELKLRYFEDLEMALEQEREQVRS